MRWPSSKRRNDGLAGDHPRRRDEPPIEVRRERAESAVTTPHPPHHNEVAAVRLTHPDKLYFPERGLTKRGLAAYYEAVADVMLPGIRDRPLTLVRCPDGWKGECFFQKQANRSTPRNLPRVEVKPGVDYLAIHSLADLIGLVQLGVLEFHVWGARADRLDRPDLLVLDLDPADDIPWPDVINTALTLRDRLAQLDLVAFARVTGGKGVHVVTPIECGITWPQAKSLTHALARELVDSIPDRFTDSLAKARRKGKILVDYLRNAHEATAIASYSVRAREGAPVAIPIDWAELQESSSPPRLSTDDVIGRVQGGLDPWRDFEASRAAVSRRVLHELRVPLE